MSVVLVNHGEEHSISFTDLEDGIRSGDIPLDCRIKYFPWTNEHFVRICDLPQLQRACASPLACFLHHLRQFSFPSATVLLVLCILAFSVRQASIEWNHQDNWFVDGVVGWENTILEARWWTIWGAQFIHFNAKHALLNIIVIAYCGFQVERALGQMAMLNILIGAVFLGGLAICFWSTYPVAGSSLTAFSLLGAQIGIGIRLSEEIPYSFRFQYGWINVTLFVPLMIATLFLPTASHLGHVICFLSGFIISIFTPSGVFSPLFKPLRWVSVFGAWSIAALGVGQLWRFPQVVSAPMQKVELNEGLHFSIPSRMIHGHAYDMHAWKFAHQSSWLLSSV